MSWYQFDNGCCWWPPKSKSKDVSKIINLGYEPNKETWESYPAQIRKKILCVHLFKCFLVWFFLIFLFFIDTYAEARRNDRVNEEILTTEDERDRKTRKSRIIKVPFDNSVVPLNKAKEKNKRLKTREIISSSNGENESFLFHHLFHLHWIQVCAYFLWHNNLFIVLYCNF